MMTAIQMVLGELARDKPSRRRVGSAASSMMALAGLLASPGYSRCRSDYVAAASLPPSLGRCCPPLAKIPQPRQANVAASARCGSR
jgi:hypothetical protein